MIKVFGIGNVILGDDGIGVKVIKDISNRFNEKEIKFYEIGIDFLKILDYIEENDYVILIDSTCSNKEVGTVGVESINKIKVDGDKVINSIKGRKNSYL